MYVVNGSRSIYHETNVQEYYQERFDFRKAYCKLNIKYRTGLGLIIKWLYPFRKLIRGKTRLGNQLEGILKMEEMKNE